MPKKGPSQPARNTTFEHLVPLCWACATWMKLAGNTGPGGGGEWWKKATREKVNSPTSTFYLKKLKSGPFISWREC
ncbi:hypothetical protein FOPE_12721 [Fonsecaea pedrosoi]|nr:hypothetical protein FOPE_12721 [Fonsecaea pedrosoi]